MSRGFVLTGSSDTPSWPVPPEYVPLWDYARIEQELTALVIFHGHDAAPVVKLSEVIELMLEMSTDYDLLLAKAQLDKWAHEGMAHNG
jgi:hypothetical protein